MKNSLAAALLVACVLPAGALAQPAPAAAAQTSVSLAGVLGSLHQGPAVAHALHVAADDEVLGDVGVRMVAVGLHGRHCTASRAR